VKTYTVIRSTSGQVGCVVNDGRGTATLLRHCVYHSPTGFETGYSGSGPADLALSILADLLDASPEAIKRKLAEWNYPHRGAEQALLFHEQFRREFITPRPLCKGDSYEIWGAQIQSWLGDLLKPVESVRRAS
jgi:hypothetical protein